MTTIIGIFLLSSLSTAIPNHRRAHWGSIFRFLMGKKWSTFVAHHQILFVRVYYHEILHGLLSHKNRRIPIKKKTFGHPPWPPGGHFFKVFSGFFLSRVKGLARLLKRYRVFIISKKGDNNPQKIFGTHF